MAIRKHLIRKCLSSFKQSECEHAAVLFSGGVARSFPCPFSARGHGVLHAYVHYTGQRKPWTRFNPENSRFLKWYLALTSLPNAADLLSAVFPKTNSSALVAEVFRAASTATPSKFDPK